MDFLKKSVSWIKYWAQILMLPIYWLSFITPRSKNIWLFGSTFGNRFADNPRYFYLYVSQNNKTNVRAIWVSRNKKIINLLIKNGYEAYYYRSLKGIYYCLRGSVYIFDNYSKDINFWTSGGALKINLWHGIPLKKIGADNLFDNVRHPKNLWDKIKYFPRRLSDEKPSHYFLATSEFMVDIFSSAFRVKNVLTSGYPRNDRLICEEPENLLSDIEYLNRKKINDFKKNNDNKSGKMVYYMPTFRDSEVKFFDVMDLVQFNKFLSENNLLFCAKLHPKSKLKKQFDEINASNIVVIDADTDPYVFLELSDVLITDYSSIYFDFLLTNKPVIFFNYDIEDYLSNSREFYFDYCEFTPGVKVQTQDELNEAIINSLSEPDKYMKERENIKNKVFDNSNKPSCQRLINDIKKIL